MAEATVGRSEEPSQSTARQLRAPATLAPMQLFVRRRGGGFCFMATVRDDSDLERWWLMMLRDDYGCEGFDA